MDAKEFSILILGSFSFISFVSTFTVTLKYFYNVPKQNKDSVTIMSLLFILLCLGFRWGNLIPLLIGIEENQDPFSQET